MTEMDLRDMDDDFDNATPETGGFTPLPDGNYQVAVDGAELVWSRAGNRMLKWTLKVLSSAHENRRVWKYHTIEQNRLGWLKADLGICGLTLDRLSELPRRLHELLDVPLEIQLVSKTGADGQEYQNCYFRKKLKFGAAENDVPPPTDDDAPF